MTATMRMRLRAAAKRFLLTAVVLSVAAVFGGLLLMISGIVPIKASSGHWPVTAAILEFAKRRSVATHTLGMNPPPLDEPRLVMQGAAHYDFACEPCHGSPSLQQPRIARQMTPRPPDLREAGLIYDPQHLFYIVKHGIKFTGMPAWPARHRDDEVWAMVAFLERMPTLDAGEYERLTGAAPAPDDRLPLEDLLGPSSKVPDAITENCARCHGADGLGRGTGAFPRLAGQRPAYLAASLEAYARGERHSGVMEPVAANLGTDEMRQIADYYAGLPAGGPAAPAPPDGELDEGRRIVTEGVPGRLIPACRECHGPGTTTNPNYPRLAGQYPAYLQTQLSLFRNKRRGGTPYHTLMHKFVGQLTDEQVRAVSRYYGSLPPDK